MDVDIRLDPEPLGIFQAIAKLKWMNTIGALLVTIAATRLSNAGLNVPKDNLIPELALYEYL